MRNVVMTLALVGVLALLAAPVQAEIITPTDADVSSYNNESMLAGNLIDASGLSATPASPETGKTHNTTAGNMWMTPVLTGGVTDQWVAFDLGGLYNLTAAYVWNFNQYYSSIPGLTGAGIATMNISVSSDSDLGTASWTQLAGTYSIPEGVASTSQLPEPSHTVSFTAGNVRLVRFDVLTVHGSYAGGTRVGLSEVRFEGAVIPEPSTLVLLGMGLVGLLCYAWRKRK